MTLPARRRQRLLRLLTSLARDPFRTGEFQARGLSDRIYEVGVFDSLLLTWWVDHAEREIRVVRIELGSCSPCDGGR